MTEQELNEFILTRNETGIAGDYYFSLKTGGSKKAMFFSFVIALEPSDRINSSLLSVSSQFWIENIEKIKRLPEEKRNKAYIVKTFENWYYDKRKKNQKAYERTVSKNIEMNTSYTLEELSEQKEKQMKERTINTYFEYHATEEEIYIQKVELGLHTPERNNKRHYVDFPSGSISHWTYIEKKKKLISKLKTIEN